MRRLASNLGSIFRARRDLALITAGWEVLGDSNLTIEEADTLVDLYGAINLDWEDPPARLGHVTFRDLMETAVHDRPSKALLSLRLKRLSDKGLLILKPIPRTGEPAELRTGPRASRTWVKITPKGAKLAEEIWERYGKLAERLLAGVPEADLVAHLRVNAIISMRKERPGASYDEVC
jgi:DNA-binding MarR family transcriptional regulator